MAWFDILGGVAGGLNQGLGQLQQAQQAKQVEARQQQLLKLQQAQDERAQKQFLQQQQDQREAEFLKGLSVQDPFNVDPTFAASYPEQAKNYLTMDPAQNKLMARMDPIKRAEAEQRMRQIEQRGQLRTQFGTPEFSALPEVDRVRFGVQAASVGMDPREILAGVGQLSDRARQALLTGIIAPDKAAELAQKREEAAAQNATALAAARIREGANDLTAKAALDYLNKPVEQAEARLAVVDKLILDNAHLPQDSRRMQGLLAEAANRQETLRQLEARRDAQLQRIKGFQSILGLAAEAAPTLPAAATTLQNPFRSAAPAAPPARQENAKLSFTR